MNIKNRLKKLEKNILIDSDLCECLDALALIATKFADICYQCNKRIDIKNWKNHHIIYPTEEFMGFAFGMLRDDSQQFTRDYFIDKIMDFDGNFNT